MSRLKRDLEEKTKSILSYIEESASRNIPLTQSNQERFIQAMLKEPHAVKQIESLITTKRREDWNKRVLNTLHSTRSYSDQQNFVLDIASHIIEQQLNDKRFVKNLKSLAECYHILDDIGLEGKANQLLEKSKYLVQRAVIGQLQHTYYMHALEAKDKSVVSPFDRLINLLSYYAQRGNNDESAFHKAKLALRHHSSEEDDYIAKEMMLSFFQGEYVIFGGDWWDAESYTAENILKDGSLKTIARQFFPEAVLREGKKVVNSLQRETSLPLSCEYVKSHENPKMDTLTIKIGDKHKIDLLGYTFKSLDTLEAMISDSVRTKLNE